MTRGIAVEDYRRKGQRASVRVGGVSEACVSFALGGQRERFVRACYSVD
jgi:hypothetical protein